MHECEQSNRDATSGSWMLRLPAPVYTVAVLVLLVAVIGLLNIGVDIAGPRTPSGPGTPLDPADREAFAVAWLTWRAVGAVAVVTFIVALLSGSHTLSQSVRNGLLPAGGVRVDVYLILASALVAGAVLMIVTGGGRNPDVPVAHLAWRTRTVLFTGLVASIPWFSLTWLCQDRCRPRDLRPWDAPDHQLTFVQLNGLWTLVVRCLGAYAIGVAAAVITAGALRFAFLAGRPQCAAGYEPSTSSAAMECLVDFPAVHVLLYGAAFAVVGLAIAVPMVASWRSCAQEWVDDQRHDDVLAHSKEWAEEQARLQSLLHLDTPVLRNPLTLLSVFTPLITSVLAAFLPQLGG